MIMRLFTTLITVVLLFCGDAAALFGAALFGAPKRGAVPNKAGISVEHTQKEQEGMTNLRFQASSSYATQPAVYHPCVADVLFQHRNSILAGTKNRVELLQKPDNSLYGEWQVEAKKNGVVPPVMGDPILRVTTTAIQFPGLTLQTVATVGCKEVPEEPALQITLIDDELQASGPPPLVWVFNQLTGAGAKSSGRRTHSTNIITAEKTDESTVVFRSDVHLAIDISFPSLLMSILPVSRGRAEKQGSAAIQSVAERDIGPALETLRGKYIAQLEKMENAHRK